MINGAGPFSCDAALARVAKKAHEVKLWARPGLPLEPVARPSGHHVPIDPLSRAGTESFPANDSQARAQSDGASRQRAI